MNNQYPHLEIKIKGDNEFYVIPDEDPKFIIYVLKNEIEPYRTFTFENGYLDIYIVLCPNNTYAFGYSSNFCGSLKVQSQSQELKNIFEAYQKASNYILELSPFNFYLGRSIFKQLTNDINPKNLFTNYGTI